MIAKVAAVAWREFSSTVLTKAFVIGAFVVPLLFALAMPFIVKLMEEAKAPVLEGRVAVVDQSGAVLAGIEERFRVEGMSAIIAETSSQARAAIAAQLGAGAMDQLESQLDNPMVAQAIEQSFGRPPVLTVEPEAADADLDALRARLKPANEGADDALVALVVVAPNAVQRAEGEQAFGGFQFFVRAKTDDRHIDLMRRGLRSAILDARYAQAGVNRDDIVALTTVPAGDTQEITDTGEARRATSELNMLLPAGFMILLIMSVMVGGQYLLTTTVEEKSSRVVEVLLSAVSPMQLMTGKILGQMGVGLVLLSVYTGTGLATLSAFAYLDLIEPMKIVYLVIYFVLAYFIFASLMAAIGSAVNEMREAQSLMTPVMLTVMLPYLFWAPISRDPNSVLALVLSMVPPMSPFAMMVRIASTEPPPLWQILASIGITAVFALGCVWFAAKVFRVGLLMYGKPPNLKTLIRWVRMA
jgi:ABC-2 type transport system permease protein